MTDERETYKTGDIVWSKTKKLPWWPAQVVPGRETHATRNSCQPITVNFFSNQECKTVKIVDGSNIVKYNSPQKEAFTYEGLKSKFKAKFQDAIASAGRLLKKNEPSIQRSCSFAEDYGLHNADTSSRSSNNELKSFRRRWSSPVRHTITNSHSLIEKDFLTQRKPIKTWSSRRNLCVQKSDSEMEMADIVENFGSVPSTPLIVEKCGDKWQSYFDNQERDSLELGQGDELHSSFVKDAPVLTEAVEVVEKVPVPTTGQGDAEYRLEENLELPSCDSQGVECGMDDGFQENCHHPGSADVNVDENAVEGSSKIKDTKTSKVESVEEEPGDIGNTEDSLDGSVLEACDTSSTCSTLNSGYRERSESPEIPLFPQRNSSTRPSLRTLSQSLEKVSKSPEITTNVVQDNLSRKRERSLSRERRINLVTDNLLRLQALQSNSKTKSVNTKGRKTKTLSKSANNEGRKVVSSSKRKRGAKTAEVGVKRTKYSNLDSQNVCDSGRQLRRSPRKDVEMANSLQTFKSTAGADSPEKCNSLVKNRLTLSPVEEEENPLTAGLKLKVRRKRSSLDAYEIVTGQNSEVKDFGKDTKELITDVAKDIDRDKSVKADCGIVQGDVKDMPVCRRTRQHGKSSVDDNEERGKDSLTAVVSAGLPSTDVADGKKTKQLGNRSSSGGGKMCTESIVTQLANISQEVNSSKKGLSKKKSVGRKRKGSSKTTVKQEVGNEDKSLTNKDESGVLEQRENRMDVTDDVHEDLVQIKRNNSRKILNRPKGKTQNRKRSGKLNGLTNGNKRSKKLKRPLNQIVPNVPDECLVPASDGTDLLKADVLGESEMPCEQCSDVNDKEANLDNISDKNILDGELPNHSTGKVKLCTTPTFKIARRSRKVKVNRKKRKKTVKESPVGGKMSTPKAQHGLDDTLPTPSIERYMEMNGTKSCSFDPNLEYSSDLEEEGSDLEELPSMLTPYHNDHPVSEKEIVWVKCSKGIYVPGFVKKVYRKKKRLSCVFISPEKRGKLYSFSYATKDVIIPFSDERKGEFMERAKSLVPAEREHLYECVKIAEDYLNKKALGKLSGDELSFFSENDTEVFGEDVPVLPWEDTSKQEEADEAMLIDLSSEAQVQPGQQGLSKKAIERKEKMNIKTLKYTDTVLSDMCKEYLEKIRTGAKPSELHTIFMTGTTKQRAQIKHQGFGPIDDDEQIDSIVYTLVQWYGPKTKENEHVNEINYIMDVWIPEAIVFALKKVHGYSNKRSWEIFRKGVRRTKEELQLLHNALIERAKSISPEDKERYRELREERLQAAGILPYKKPTKLVLKYD